MYLSIFRCLADVYLILSDASLIWTYPIIGCLADMYSYCHRTFSWY